MKKKVLFSSEENQLFKAVLQLKDLGEAQKFFRDLLTEEELQEFALRWKVAQMLSEKVPYTQIEKQTGMSSTTIARISKWLNDGMNGYKLMISRLSKVTSDNSAHHPHTAG